MKENINSALHGLAEPLVNLRLDERNARQHDERSIDSIRRSLESFGQQKPIVALNDGTIIAGNGTYVAAQALGWGHLAVVRFDDAAKARAYGLADNRTAELSTWDAAELARTLEELSASGDWMPEAVGFTQDELDSIILGGAPLPMGGEAREYDETVADELTLQSTITCPSCAHQFIFVS